MNDKIGRQSGNLDTFNDESEFISRLRKQYDFMSESQHRIANYIREHPNMILKHSITTLAEKINTSPSTISRFCQTLHYRGFSDMKFCIEKDIFSLSGDGGQISVTDDIASTKKKMYNLYLSALTDTILQLDNHQLDNAVDAICRANIVYLYANGGPSASANFAYQLFLQIGIPCNYFEDNVSTIMSASHLKMGDVAIGISYSGDSSAMLNAIELIKHNKVLVIGITSHVNSPLGKLSDITLGYSPRIEDDLRYRHIARMCEIAIIGQLQSAIINRMPEKIVRHIRYSKIAIEESRSKSKSMLKGIDTGDAV
jgi:DNA-binding MurR/RpiR family transcriptional regulator